MNALATLIIILSIYSLSIHHPISLMMCLLMQVIINIMMCNIICNTFWYSYLLFLMMISGILIIFMYMTSITANKKFYLKPLMFYIVLSPPMFMYNHNFAPMISHSPPLPLMMNNFFSTPLMFMLILLVAYLLLTMIATVKIINLDKGPLRQKF